ncbi:hypothetical protein scyTo_0018009 [Scyliorhinus torazame]|uniref:Uncharacterized protein n=1 Tax=Scyliorhinus torazame TaxID=75743 RepID=A0A401Q3X2_SCYTO|nr:hypothetical protein [Scyliorhinus torazame]
MYQEKNLQWEEDNPVVASHVGISDMGRAGRDPAIVIMRNASGGRGKASGGRGKASGGRGKASGGRGKASDGSGKASDGSGKADGRRPEPRGGRAKLRNPKKDPIGQVKKPEDRNFKSASNRIDQGFINDDDLKAMLKGSSMQKIKSSSWMKPRFYKLLEDCRTVWYDSQKILKSARAQIYSHSEWFRFTLRMVPIHTPNDPDSHSD